MHRSIHPPFPPRLFYFPWIRIKVFPIFEASITSENGMAKGTKLDSPFLPFLFLSPTLDRSTPQLFEMIDASEKSSTLSWTQRRCTRVVEHGGSFTGTFASAIDHDSSSSSSSFSLSLCVIACLPGRFVSAMKEISIMADNEVDS